MMLKLASPPTLLLGTLVLFISGTGGEPIRELSSTMTTEKPESGVLDDLVNQATTIYGPDPICTRCHEKVNVAQRTVEIHDELSKKHKILGKRRAMEAAQATARPTDPNRLRKANSSSISTRSLPDNPKQQIIEIARLRVARSSDGSRSPRRIGSKDKHLLGKKDEYERVKADLQSQKEKACKELFEVHECLEELQNECIGDLYFHSYEVFFEQLWVRLLCRHPYSPSVKPFPMLQQRDFPSYDHVPAARPIPPTSDEVRERIHRLLPDRPHPSALVELRQRPPVPSGGPYRPMQGQQHGNSIDPLFVARVLLVPACFIILVLVTLLATIRYKRVKGEDDCDDKDGTSQMDRSFFTVV